MVSTQDELETDEKADLGHRYTYLPLTKKYSIKDWIDDNKIAIIRVIADIDSNITIKRYVESPKSFALSKKP